MHTPLNHAIKVLRSGSLLILMVPRRHDEANVSPGLRTKNLRSGNRQIFPPCLFVLCGFWHVKKMLTPPSQCVVRLSEYVCSMRKPQYDGVCRMLSGGCCVTLCNYCRSARLPGGTRLATLTVIGYCISGSVGINNKFLSSCFPWQLVWLSSPLLSFALSFKLLSFSFTRISIPLQACS